MSAPAPPGDAAAAAAAAALSDCDAAAADAGAASSLAMAFIFLAVGLLVGFFLGTRARQVIASLRAVGSAMRRAITLKIPSIAAESGPTPTGGGDDDDKAEDEDEDVSADLLDSLMQPVDADTLTDHPDVMYSPVLQYQIKKAKEEQRLEAQRQQLLAEGLSLEEVEAELAAGGGVVGGGGGMGRQNPLALLISIGARVEATRGGDSAEAAAAQARKRALRNVDAYLSRVQGIDTKHKTAGGKGGHKRMARVKQAHEVAAETMLHRAGGTQFVRSEANAKRAKANRLLYRRWLVVNGAQLAAFRRTSLSSDGDGGGMVPRRGGGEVDADMLAKLQAELGANGGDLELGGEEDEAPEQEFESEEGEEGEEGEGSDEPDSELELNA